MVAVAAVRCSFPVSFHSPRLACAVARICTIYTLLAPSQNKEFLKLKIYPKTNNILYKHGTLSPDTEANYECIQRIAIKFKISSAKGNEMKVYASFVGICLKISKNLLGVIEKGMRDGIQ